MLAYWQELLGEPNVDPEADFFELGGQSLMAVRLFAWVRKTYGADLPISALLQHPTVRSLTAYVTEQAASMALVAPELVHSGKPEDAPWDTSVMIHPGPGTGATPLFIAGGVGGNVNNLVHLGRAIGRSRPVIGLQTRGVLGHRPHDSIEAAAADNITHVRRRQPEGPYLLAGYSGGALTAFEMARQLRDAGHEVGWLGILDMAAPGFWKRIPLPLMRRMGFAAKSFGRRGPIDLWRRGQPWLRDKFLTNRVIDMIGPYAPPIMKLLRLSRHWIEVAERYAPAPYDGDIWLYLTQPDTQSDATQMARDPLVGWGQKVMGQVHLTQSESDHFSILAGSDAGRVADWIEAGVSMRPSKMAERATDMRGTP
jgi:thioesterase domain-containing protein/acyl carrier protein